MENKNEETNKWNSNLNVNITRTAQHNMNHLITKKANIY